MGVENGSCHRSPLRGGFLVRGKGGEFDLVSVYRERARRVRREFPRQ